MAKQFLIGQILLSLYNQHVFARADLEDYHWLNNNCLSFANDFCRKLGASECKSYQVVNVELSGSSEAPLAEVLVEFQHGLQLGV